jgi:hypothetical protein
VESKSSFLTVGSVGFFDSTVVCNIFSLGIDAVETKISLKRDKREPTYEQGKENKLNYFWSLNWMILFSRPEVFSKNITYENVHQYKCLLTLHLQIC